MRHLAVGVKPSVGDNPVYVCKSDFKMFKILIILQNFRKINKNLDLVLSSHFSLYLKHNPQQPFGGPLNGRNLQ